MKSKKFNNNKIVMKRNKKPLFQRGVEIQIKLVEDQKQDSGWLARQDLLKRSCRNNK
jgi:hypothetical protein